ncbi:MAG TPA: hypothetical protein VFU13_03265 [Steroidobacteraceae bacterium]|nr:hypothetical protein [Steroidobacteraceae bacterium]
MNRHLICVAIGTLAAANAGAATMFSTQDSYMGPGTFYGPGRVQDVTIFDVQINHIVFPSPTTFVTPFTNNGAKEPNICGDREIRDKSTGVLSDGVTPLNENVNACAFKLKDMKILVGVVKSGAHQGEQISVVLDGGHMLMTMDFALDLGVGSGGIIKLPFYGTTGEVTVPKSLQSQMNIEGGIDQAGSLKPGDKIRGRLGDFNNDGMLDGAIVVAGNIPLSSIFMPGAPYALIRYFDTDVPYSGQVLGRLPGERQRGGSEPPKLTVVAPADDPIRAVARKPQGGSRP